MRDRLERNAIIAILLSIQLAATAEAVAAPQCGEKGKWATEFGQLATPPPMKVLKKGQEFKTFDGSDANSLGDSPTGGSAVQPRYYMFRMVASPASAKDWSLTLRGTNMQPLQVLGPADFQSATSSGRWSNRLETPSVAFDLYLGPQAGDVKVSIVDAILMPDNVSKSNARYSWKGDAATYSSLYNSPFGAEENRAVRQRGDRVGFFMGLELRNSAAGDGMAAASDSTASWCCTGVMLTKDLFLTNWHCGLPNEATAGNAWRESAIAGSTCDTLIIDLSWDDDGVGEDASCKKVEFVDKELDYAMLRVQPVGGTRQELIGSRPLSIATGRVKKNAELHLIHHAECKRKLLSHSCRVLNDKHPNWQSNASATRLTDFTHDCDTESGSSGAPVFDAAGRLVGLHHLGFAFNSANTCDGENKAVHIMDILDHLKLNRRPLYDEVSGALNFVSE